MMFPYMWTEPTEARDKASFEAAIPDTENFIIYNAARTGIYEPEKLEALRYISSGDMEQGLRMDLAHSKDQ